MDTTTPLECNNADDCGLPDQFQCNKMTNLTPSGKIGYCVPLHCKSDRSCYDIGQKCFSGVLSGTCNFMKQGGTCEYHPFLAKENCCKKELKTKLN